MDRRTARCGSACTLIQDIASRINARVQMTTDGPGAYMNAVDDAFGADIDYATLQKTYAAAQDNDTRYSPAKIISSTTEIIQAGKSG